MPSRELRMATALAHSVVGAALGLAVADGSSIVVGRHPAADVDPCEWRRRVIDRREPLLDSGATPVAVAGVVRPIGGGVFVGRDPREMWIVAEACARRSVAAIRRAVLPDGTEDGVTVSIRPDIALGVTVLRLGLDGPDGTPMAPADRDGVRSAIVAELLAIELEADLQPVRRAEESS
ncbi:MAG: hypothetical protein RIB98_14065 [Acidimicrobiales bacterium]